MTRPIYIVTGMAGADPELEAAVRCLNGTKDNGCPLSREPHNPLLAQSSRQRRYPIQAIRAR